MQEAKKSIKEKGIKVEDVKILPPIEENNGSTLLRAFSKDTSWLATDPSTPWLSGKISEEQATKNGSNNKNRIFFMILIN